MNKLFSCLLMALITIGLPVLAQQVKTDGANFNFEVEEYNFGSIKQGETVSYEFKFANNGSEPLVISNAAGSCGCTVPVYPKSPIAVGQKAAIKVTFDSNGKRGMIDKTVTLTSNAKGGNKILHIKGNVELPPGK
jgi:hypothetical protein